VPWRFSDAGKQCAPLNHRETASEKPAQHRTKLHSTNPIERLNKEVKRRADVVGIFPNEEAITRLIGAVLLEQNDEWQTQHRYMQVEAFSQTGTSSTDPLLSIQMQAA
jgi:transposase-like protein